jgi:hypothetical protein
LIATLIAGVLVLGMALWSWRPFAFGDLSRLQSTKEIRIYGYVWDSVGGRPRHVTITDPPTVNRVLSTLDIQTTNWTRDRLSSPYSIRVTFLDENGTIAELIVAEYSTDEVILEEHTSLGDMHPAYWRQLHLASRQFPRMVQEMLTAAPDVD